MAIAYLSRIERFNAAHKLWVREWSEEQNFEVFGKCANKNWHGHNYTLIVTVKGIPDPMTGMIIDARLLSKIIKENVTEKLDHSNLNMDVDFIPQNIMPTTENLVILICPKISPNKKLSRSIFWGRRQQISIGQQLSLD